AVPEARAFAEQQESSWVCVCGSLNPGGRASSASAAETCRTCSRARELVLSKYTRDTTLMFLEREPWEVTFGDFPEDPTSYQEHLHILTILSKAAEEQEARKERARLK